MASQELVPASLPDTQNADAILTQSQEISSQQPTLTVWGRLCPLRPCFPSLDMVNDSAYTLGRSLTCNINLTNNEIKEKLLNGISKIHFRIYRERINNTNEIVVYLEDLSRNGTFVDRNLVGCNNRVIIENNSEIALMNHSLSVYRFVSTNVQEIYELPQELKQKYAIGRKLGAGACGEVRLLFTKDGSGRFAIKTIRKNYFSTGNNNIFNNPENVRNEVEILRRLRHPCIIHLEDIHDTRETMYIILELMEGGELFDRIRSKGKLSELDGKLIFYQVVLAVHYLHKQGITHRDLKPENILLKDNSNSPLVKVSDFGLSKFVDAQTMMKTFCGTPMYVAPEILKTHGRNSYTNKVDVWSLGVILFVCLSGTLPFTDRNQNVPLHEQIIGGMFEFRHLQHLSQDALNLIKWMMTVDPIKRITMSQILLHPWLRDPSMQREVHRLISGDSTGNDENVPPSNVYHKRPRRP